jgi:hypothetical protein
MALNFRKPSLSLARDGRLIPDRFGISRRRDSQSRPQAQVEFGAHHRPERLRSCIPAPDVALPIASITKLMTALVLVLDAQQPLDQPIQITEADRDSPKASFHASPSAPFCRGRLDASGFDVIRESCRPCAGSNYPGGMSAMVSAMNAKAATLGMTNCISSIPPDCRVRTWPVRGPVEAGDRSLAQCHHSRVFHRQPP